jgi:hypothetical protein
MQPTSSADVSRRVEAWPVVPPFRHDCSRSAAPPSKRRRMIAVAARRLIHLERLTLHSPIRNRIEEVEEGQEEVQEEMQEEVELRVTPNCCWILLLRLTVPM